MAWVSRHAMHMGPALLLIAVAAGCGSRSVTTGDGGVWRSDAPPLDGLRADYGRRDGVQPRDAPPETFCSGAPRAEIGGAAQSVSEIESGTMLTSCCEGELMRLKTSGPVGQVSVEVLMLRTPGASVGALSIDLGHPPKGWSFTVRCAPYERCGYLHTQNSEISGSLTINPLPGPPAWGAALCLTAEPRPEVTGIKPVRLWGTAQIKRHCTFGLDQTCNPSPLISALYGKCNQDGTCTCTAGYVKDPSSGKCKTP